MTADRRAWATEDAEEHPAPLPQRTPVEPMPERVVREVPAWLLQPTGYYREIIDRIRHG